jgi:hypothetical protein
MKPKIISFALVIAFCFVSVVRKQDALLRGTTSNSYENKTNFNSASSRTPSGDCCAEGRIRAG